MSLLRDAINAKATPHQRAAMAADDWCKGNPSWVRICDIPNDQYEDTVLNRWETLTPAQKRPWRRNYQKDAQAAWEQWGRDGSYKVATGYIMEDGRFLNRNEFHRTNLCDRGFMMVFNLGETNG